MWAVARFITVTFNIFRLLKGFTTIWEGSNDLKLYSVDVSFYQICKFVTLEENKRQKRSFFGFKTIVLGLFLPNIFTEHNIFACLIKDNFYRIQF